MKFLSSTIKIMALGAFVLSTALTAHSAVRSEKNEEFIREAEEYINKGELKAAIIQLKNALRADPDDGEARLTLGILYNRVGNAVSAEKELKRAQSLGIEKKRVVLPLSSAYLLQRKFDEILPLLSVADVDEKDKASAYLVVGNAHQGLGDVDKALEYFLKGEEVKDKDDKLSVAIARIYAFKGEQENALAKVNQALEINPKNIQGLILKGDLVLKKEGPKEALAYFESALQYSPENVTAMVKVAGVQFDLKRDDEALEKIEDVFSRIPNHPLASYLAAVIHARRNEADKARDYLENAGPALDKFPPALMLRGVINYSQKNYAQAIYHLSRLVEISPDHIVARRVLGASLLRQGDAEQAIKILKPVIEGGKADSIVYTLMGSAHMKLGKFEEGTSFFEKAVAEKPGESRLKAQLAMSKLVQGDTKAAELNLQEILEKDPNSRQASVFLTLIALREKNYDKALEGSDLVIKQMPENPTGYNFKGTAYMRSDKPLEARRLFNKALELKPEYHPARMNLALLEQKVGDLGAARKIYNDVLARNKNYVAAWVALAKISVREKDVKGGISSMDKAIAIAPKRIDLRVKLSELYLTEKDMDKANATARQIIQDFPDQAAGYEASGKINMMMGDISSAISNFHRLTALLGENSGAFRLLGQAQVRSGDIVNARKSLVRGLEATEKKGPLLLDLIRLEMSQRNYADAHAYVKDVYELQGDVWQVDVLEGRVFMGEEKFDKALEVFDLAKTKGATGANFSLLLANSYFSLKDGARGKGVLFNWLREHDDDNVVRHALANKLLQEEARPEAIREYATILKFNEADVLAMNNLAWLYSQTKQSGKALTLAKSAYDKVPNNPSVADTYAWILIQKGDNKEGLEILQKAVSRAPDMMELRYHLAVALKGEGRASAARRELEMVVSSGEMFGGLDEAKALLQELSGN